MCWPPATTSTPPASPSPARPAAASCRRSPPPSTTRVRRRASAASSTPTSPAARRRLRHRLGRLGRPLQPGAAPRRDRQDGRVVGAAAPRDVIVVHAVDDPPFPIRGARTVVREARDVYAALRVRRPRASDEVSGGHGLHAATRTTAAAALARGARPPAAAARGAAAAARGGLAGHARGGTRRAAAGLRRGRRRACRASRCRRASTATRRSCGIARDLAARLRDGREPDARRCRGDARAADTGTAVPYANCHEPLGAAGWLRRSASSSTSRRT